MIRRLSRSHTWSSFLGVALLIALAAHGLLHLGDHDCGVPAHDLRVEASGEAHMALHVSCPVCKNPTGGLATLVAPDSVSDPGAPTRLLLTLGRQLPAAPACLLPPARAPPVPA